MIASKITVAAITQPITMTTIMMSVMMRATCMTITPANTISAMATVRTREISSATIHSNMAVLHKEETATMAPTTPSVMLTILRGETTTTWIRTGSRHVDKSCMRRTAMMTTNTTGLTMVATAPTLPVGITKRGNHAMEGTAHPTATAPADQTIIRHETTAMVATNVRAVTDPRTEIREEDIAITALIATAATTGTLYATIITALTIIQKDQDKATGVKRCIPSEAMIRHQATAVEKTACH